MNIDSDLHMFIATVCDKCRELDCKGAFDSSSRAACGLYNTWLKLSPTEKSKKFLSSVADTTLFIEELTR